MLCAAAGFHANEARLPVGKVFEKLLALELQTHDFSCLPVDPVQLKHPFGWALPIYLVAAYNN